MKASHRLRITTTRRRIVRFHPTAVRAICPVCAREVEMLSRTQAADVLELDDLMLEALIAAGQVHTIRTVSGSLRVCRDSLWVDFALRCDDKEK